MPRAYTVKASANLPCRSSARAYASHSGSAAGERRRRVFASLRTAAGVSAASSSAAASRGSSGYRSQAAVRVPVGKWTGRRGEHLHAALPPAEVRQGTVRKRRSAGRVRAAAAPARPLPDYRYRPLLPEEACGSRNDQMSRRHRCGRMRARLVAGGVARSPVWCECEEDLVPVRVVARDDWSSARPQSPVQCPQSPQEPRGWRRRLRG